MLSSTIKCLFFKIKHCLWHNFLIVLKILWYITIEPAIRLSVRNFHHKKKVRLERGLTVFLIIFFNHQLKYSMHEKYFKNTPANIQIFKDFLKIYLKVSKWPFVISYISRFSRISHNTIVYCLVFLV